MRRLVLFIAISADGFIARKNGAIDWLPSGDDLDYGFGRFLRTVDTLLMGRKTYEQVLTFGPFPHPDKRCYVFTRRRPHRKPGFPRPSMVEFVHGDPVAFAKRLRRRRGSSIWLVGGAQLIRPLQEAGAIDEYVLSICPVFIGSGIPLFLDTGIQRALVLKAWRRYRTGVVQLTYTKRERTRSRGTARRTRPGQRFHRAKRPGRDSNPSTRLDRPRS